MNKLLKQQLESLQETYEMTKMQKMEAEKKLKDISRFFRKLSGK